MNIGIDIDGVLLDTESWFRAYAEIYDMDTVKHGVVEPQSAMFQKRHGWDESTLQGFVSKYGLEVMRKAPLMPGLIMVLNRLRGAGHKLIIVTARGKWGKEETEITNQFLDSLEFKFDKVYLNISDKASICKQENIDYMIDDSPNNIHLLSSNGIKSLYFRDVNREKITANNVTEVNSWAEILKFLTR